MAGLREEKKYQNQLMIIKEATLSFLEKGYQQSKMVDIAKKANVGTGTIYNYYPSKGKLLLAVFEKEFDDLQDGKRMDITHKDGSLIQKITDVMEMFLRFFDDFPKSFWREIIHVMTEDAEESNGIRSGFFGLDEEMMNILRGIIEQHDSSFKMQLDSTQMTQAIYSIVMMQAMIFIYEEQVTFQQLLSQINQQIECIFAGKLIDETEE